MILWIKKSMYLSIDDHLNPKYVEYDQILGTKNVQILFLKLFKNALVFCVIFYIYFLDLPIKLITCIFGN